MTPVERARRHLAERTGLTARVTGFAPGRVNLIGEHTDYNDGFVLPVALDRGTAVAWGPAPGDSLSVYSEDFAETDRFDPNEPFEAAPGWRGHVRAVAAAWRDAGGGSPAGAIAIAGNLPQGAGLSSSASLGVALAGAFAAATRVDVPAIDLARIAQAAENRYLGCACGLMDQMAAAFGVRDAALLIDCRHQTVETVEIPTGLTLFVAHSGVRRELIDSAYNDRRTACERAAEALGVPALRDVDAGMLAGLGRQVEAVDLVRARHVVTENARVLSCVDALRRSDVAALGRLFRDSHRSMRDDFEITVPAIDRLVDGMNAALGDHGGARMTGGGFGGCVVAIADNQGSQWLADALPGLLEATGGECLDLHSGDGLQVSRGAA